MTAGTVVITGGILAAVILLCIIAVLCYCRLQYYCCKKNEVDDANEEDEASASPRGPACNACSSQMEPPGGLAPHPREPHSRPCPACSPYSSPFYIRTADMVPNGGGQWLNLPPAYYKEGGPMPLKVAAPQSFPVTVTWSGLVRDAFTSPRAISTDV